MQAFFHILGDAVEQEGNGIDTLRTILPGAQQRAIEQEGCDVRIWSHAGWYAGQPASGKSTS